MKNNVNFQATTPNLVTTLPGNLQIVNVRASAPGQQPAQKTTTVGQQRVVNVINPQLVRTPSSTVRSSL